MTNNYTADDIRILSGLDAIRESPSMYIGIPEDPRHLLVEVIDNAIDEAINGYSDKTVVRYSTKTREVEVTDYGRGIPQGDKEILDHNGNVSGTAPALEILFAIMNSGGKFSGSDSFKISGGLHGLGNKITNALSSKLWVQSRRDGQVMTYISRDGGIKVDLTTEKMTKSHQRGTTVKFVPDSTVFETDIIPRDFIISKCRIANSLGYKIELYINDELIDLGTGEIRELLPPTESSVYTTTEISHSRDDGQSVRVLMDYTSATKTQSSSYSNMIETYRGGSHVTEFHEAIKHAWEPYIKDRVINPDDTLLGVNAVVSVFLSDAKYASQTKERLAIKRKSQQYADLVSLFSELSDELSKFLKNNPKIRDSLLDRFEEYRKSMSRLQSQKEINELIITNDETTKTGKVRRRSIVTKLRECSSTDRTDTELFITEGDSASGNALKTRDIKKQAVFPIRGKLLNVAKVNNILSNIKNEEVRGIANSAGTGVGKDCDPTKSRYDRYIINTDADCFTGDTRVKLLDGTTPTFEELAKMEEDNPGQSYWTYSSLPDGTVVPGEAFAPRIINYVDTIVTVELDNGTKIECTPDHRFMLRDGTYKEAQYLSENDSLMPMYTKVEKDANRNSLREWVLDNALSEYRRSYHMSYDGTKGLTNPRESGYAIHHLDHNTRNDDPRNLVKWSSNYHGSYHLKLYNGTDDQELNSIKGIISKSLVYMMKKGIPINELSYNDNKMISAVSFTKLLDIFGTIESAIEYAKDRIDRYDLSDYNSDSMGLLGFNKSESHRESVRDMNRDSSMKLKQSYGKVLNSVMYLLANNIPINEDNFNTNRQYGCPSYSRSVDLFSESFIEDGTNKYNELGYDSSTHNKYSDIDRSYLVGRKSPYDKVSKFRKQVGNVISRMIAEELPITEDNYNTYKGPRTPKWSSVVGELFEDYDELMSYAKTYNHKVKSVKVENRSSTPVYCWTVKDYSNFTVIGSNPDGSYDREDGVVVHNCDGIHHIAPLLISMFVNILPNLVKEGMVYVLLAPLYGWKEKDKYRFSDDLNEIPERIRSNKDNYTRYKGLIASPLK